ncbi:hypothetical protein [Rhizobium phage RHEph16]|uniref:Uncharacterized protein n=1 Tax=Rhizobium phage RHEph16 TaxID=2836132 RepID=A0AAE7VM84_9CAUD|nr:hypothetical protein PP750_gp31 [Rhizobium phage RHEph16]QXV74340.1 hypothetical protein [Rhizobium phage RHEph16]
MPKGVPKNFKSDVLMRRIKKLEDAVVELSWAGSKPPEDRPELEKAYRKARNNLVDYVLEHVI